jgi:predicted CXXCH cytochrome family protein
MAMAGGMSRFLLILLFASGASRAAENGLVGRDVCSGCHKSIAATQQRTAMSHTWQGTGTTQIPVNLVERHAEGPEPKIQYQVKRSAGDFEFGVQLPGRVVQNFPVATTVGGDRHGISFLFRVPNLEGLPLPRAPLVEARYLHYVPHQQLERSPGFPEEKPANYETAFGRVLTPGFERKCLTCHGEPRKIGPHIETGVTCESCHGPGRQHLSGIAAKSADKQIVNPKRLPVREQMSVCAQCHSGFSVVEDPLPDDLLISDQVTALSNSECWRQSGGNITCTNCHDPHQDAPRAVLVQRSESTCLSCHALKAKDHAALCPVNRTGDCVECHMPDEIKAPLHVADHWIRVHDDRPGAAQTMRAEWRTTVKPKHMYLRMIAVDDRQKAEALRQQITAGAPFFELARAHSTDPETAKNGGFLGDLTANEMDPAWAEQATNLRQGEISAIAGGESKFFVIQRMPRNFREKAERRFNKAMELRRAGERAQSAAELLEALKIYPRLLRALTFLGVTYGEAGNPQAGAAILILATQLYPKDAGAHFNLAIALGSLGNSEETTEYRRALEIDPYLVTAYLNLGAACYAKGDYAEAIRLYLQGIQINPLIASLHYSLGVALQQRGDSDEAQREFTLANTIDPNVSKR